MNPQQNTPVQRLWRFLCSLKLTLFTLILLALTSIIGTVIQQNRPPAEYVEAYGERLYNLFEALQLIDMYHSWWFLALLVLFCLNLIACSIDRLPRVLRIVRQPTLVQEESALRSLDNFTEIDSASDSQQTVRKLCEYLEGRFARPTVTETGGRIHLFAQKAPWARFGVYVTHLSILIIFVGAIIGNVWGFKGYVNIVEGEQIDTIWPRGGGEPIPLGFAVRCDDFNVTYYDGSSRPKEFSSILDVIDGGEEVISDRKIVVNDPLNYAGITFYQSSYGPAGAASLKLRITPVEGEAYEVSAAEGQRIRLAGGGSFTVTGYAPSYQGLGSAIQMQVTDAEGRRGAPFVVFQNFPDFDKKRGGSHAFALLDYQQRQYTGLQVKKDPGVWVVWLGCLLLVVGSLAAFMISHRRLWVSVEPAPSGSKVLIGGSAHRNQGAFGLYFDNLVRDLDGELRS